MSKPKVVKCRILVVDDEPLVGDAVKMMLAHDGHVVETATNGTEALACLEQAAFDLVITDYFMPEMKGDELAQHIQQRHPDLPVVLITAHEENLKAQRTPLPGVSSVISKPFLIDDLRAAIRQTVAARR